MSNPSSGRQAPDYAAHVERNRDRYLRELIDFISIPSVSTLPQHKDDVKRAAEWVKGDPRRGGRTGLTYAFGSDHPGQPVTRNRIIVSSASKAR